MRSNRLLEVGITGQAEDLIVHIAIEIAADLISAILCTLVKRE